MRMIFMISLLLFAACTVSSPDQGHPIWADQELSDVQTQESFILSSFERPVLVESFAVWCPTCTRQQQIIEDLKQDRDDFVAVSINTDPNEDAQIVRDHIEEHNFSGRYAIAPAELTQMLIDQYGFKVVNAPQVPIILLCPDGSNRLLDPFVKSDDKLIDAIESC